MPIILNSVGISSPYLIIHVKMKTFLKKVGPKIKIMVTFSQLGTL